MIQDFFFFCPNCKTLNSIRTKGRRAFCEKCNAEIVRKGRMIGVNGDFRKSDEWFAEIKDMPIPPCAEEPDSLHPGEKCAFIENNATLSQAQFFSDWSPSKSLHAVLELPQVIATGCLTATNKRLLFKGKSQTWSFSLDKITCVTTDSNHFIFKVKGLPYYQIDAKSPLQLEIFSRRLLDKYWLEKEERYILEYQPRLIFKDGLAEQLTPHRYPRRVKTNNRYSLDKFAYFVIRGIAAAIFRVAFRVKIYGKKNMPKRGGCIVILNHEGYLDAFFAQSLLPRNISFLAKNSEFKNALNRYILKIFSSIPVRRYEIDPGCVRNVLNKIAQQQAVGIFWEGERTWDGNFLPPKRGTVKLLIRAGVPVIPVRIKGSFEVLPRWDKGLQFHRVSLHISQPINFDHSKISIEKATKIIMKALENPVE